ncbi:hypothetical protein G9A89_014151 [Geosiphon pyriformis]|nr:hypothetical protein G9A89_014151 [Geosiphon pyriformis]
MKKYFNLMLLAIGINSFGIEALKKPKIPDINDLTRGLIPSTSSEIPSETIKLKPSTQPIVKPIQGNLVEQHTKDTNNWQKIPQMQPIISPTVSLTESPKSTQAEKFSPATVTQTIVLNSSPSATSNLGIWGIRAPIPQIIMGKCIRGPNV